MKRKITKRRMLMYALMCMCLFVPLTAESCGEEPAKGGEAKEQKFQNDVANRKNQTVGVPNVKNFAESRNLKRYYEEVDDPKRTGYVYLLNFGKIYAEYTVEGKVSSLNSSFTSPDKIVKSDYGEGWESNVVAQAEPDGSYGEYPDGIFFWTTDGILIEWSGDYQYSTERLELREPPQISLVKNVK